MTREEEQGSRCRLLRKAKEASIREPQLDERRQAPGTDNHQWREAATRPNDWRGSGGAKLPQWRRPTADDCRTAAAVPREKALQRLNESVPPPAAEGLEEPSRRRLLLRCLTSTVEGRSIAPPSTCTRASRNGKRKGCPPGAGSNALGHAPGLK